MTAAIVLSGCATSPVEDMVAAEAGARAADQLYVRLSGELSGAMQAGDPVAAVA